MAPLPSTSPAVHRLLSASEPVRAVADAGALVAGLPLLMNGWAVGARGESHPVLVLPGLLATDASTLTLRWWVSRLGYPVTGWDLGRNHGPTPSVVDGLPRLVEKLADTHGEPVSIVGWSLGGIYARKLALRMPQHVRQVITLGSPFGSTELDGNTPGHRTYRRYAHLHAPDRIHPSDEAAREPLPAPSTSVYSRWDGIVDWRSCLQPVSPNSENISVRASHLGLGYHPAVLWIVADRLAQARDDWRPFVVPDRFGLRALFTGVEPAPAPRSQTR
jgi:pimeloyl-ACP methyl ester carboxylesterase